MQEAYVAQLAADAAAAERAAPDSPRVNSPASRSRHKRIDSPTTATADLLSPDVSISSAETESQSESQSEDQVPTAKATPGKQKSTADTAVVPKQAEAALPTKAKPKRGRAPKAAKQDKAVHAEQHHGTVQGSQEAGAEAAPAAEAAAAAVPEPATASQPKAKRKKAVHAAKSALPLASAKASTAELHASPETAQLDLPASQPSQPPQSQAATASLVPAQLQRQFLCARIRPWTRRNPTRNPDQTVNDDRPPDVVMDQPAEAHATSALAAAAAVAATGTAAATANVADSKRHVGSAARPHVTHPEHHSTAQPAADKQQPPQVHQPQPMQSADAQQSPTSRPMSDPHGQLSSERQEQMSIGHVDAAGKSLPAAADASHTGESSGALKPGKPAAPVEQRSKSSHRGELRNYCKRKGNPITSHVTTPKVMLNVGMLELIRQQHCNSCTFGNAFPTVLLHCSVQWLYVQNRSCR